MYGFHYANFHHSVSFVVTPNFYSNWTKI